MNKLTLLAVLAACLFTFAYAAVDETPYEPTSEIDQFHWKKFDASIDYAKDIGIYRIAPWVIVGIVLVLVFLIWSCCRCCHCGCCDHTYDMSTTTRNILAVVAVACGIAGVIILIYGFKADEVQRDAVNSLPELFQNVIDWKNEFIDATDNITASVNLLTTDVNDIQTKNNAGPFIDNAEITTVQTTLTDINTLAADISSQLSGTDFESMKADYADTAAKYDDYRHLAVIILFAVCLGFLLIQLIFALMNAYAIDSCKPANCCCCLQPIITGIHLLLIFLAFIISAVLFGVATGLADLCVDADNNLLTAASLQSEQIAVYYIKCDSETLTNPIYNQTQDISVNFNDTRDAVNAWKTQLQGDSNCASNQDCTDIITILNNALTHLTALEESVGVYSPSAGEYTTGVLRLVDCTEVNGKYQAVLNSTCGTLFDSVRRTFIVMVLFAFVMVLAEVLYRWLGDAHRQADSDFDGKAMPMKNMDSPPPYNPEKPSGNGWNRV